MSNTTIPFNIQHEIFPGNSLSVLDFLRFPLPPTLSSCTSEKIDEYFDNEIPTITEASEIIQLPSPPVALVRKLDAALEHAVTAGASSIKCPHVWWADGETYPLWVITYWKDLISIQATRELWATANDTLRQHSQVWKSKGDTSVTLVDKVRDAFTSLPWSGPIRGFGPNATDDISILTRYISQEWLKGEHGNQMLDLLRMDLERDGNTNIKSLFPLGPTTGARHGDRCAGTARFHGEPGAKTLGRDYPRLWHKHRMVW